MTATVTSPPRAAARRDADSGPEAGAALLAGGRAGAAAALLGLLLLAVPVLAVWWGEDRSGTDVAGALRSTAHLWLVAHGTVLEVPNGRLGLVPLGLSVLPAWLCWRAGRRAVRFSGAARPRAALHAVAGVCLLYGGLAVVAAAAAATDVGPLPVAWTAVAGPVLLAGAASAGGALRALDPTVLPRPPRRVVDVLRTATAATVLLLGAGALMAGAALALDVEAAAGMAEASEPGAVGGLGLALLGMSLAPNAAVWGASWLAGPGFALGDGTSVGPFGVELGPVPALPLLAALPQAPPSTSLAVLALAVPVLAAVLAGRLFGTVASWSRLAADAGAAGLLAGGLVGLLAALAGGPLGGERLAVVGPSGVQVAAAVATQVAVGVLAGSAVKRLVGQRGEYRNTHPSP